MVSAEVASNVARTPGAIPAAGIGVALALLVGLPIALLRAEGTFEAVIILAAVGVAGGVAAFDLRTRRAPNVVTYPAIAAFTAAAALISLQTGLEALAGALVMFGVFLVIAVAGRGRMGFGDVKMAAVSGAIVGLRGVVPLLLITFVAGALVAVFMMVVLKRRRQETVAFTPFLALGVVGCLAAFDLYLVG
ncbi:MAG TPA: A24 family peptidase [Tepidiformaceae bacterium]